MSKSQVTLINLEEALDRILTRQTRIIPSTQKLSVKAVEEEAGLGNGSAYYYKDFVKKVKDCAVKNSPKANAQNAYEEKIANLRERLNNETRLKEKYRNQVGELKTQLANMASQHNELALTIQQYQYQVAELETSNTLSMKRS
ncbi:hypothetical protein [Shewanella waksmanii]|uniref:hypothetical protein n=1 Tax=Shewanella waksmanii TaxID=213783 RepID=UPI00048E9CA9|nr:hypothetical protein [Shewanella waksmanii]